MAPTLLRGDMVLTTRGFPFAKDRAERGQLWVYASRDPSGTALVKRIVAIPGDAIAMGDYILYVNRTPSSEALLAPDSGTPTRAAATSGSTDGFAWQIPYLVPGVDPASYRPTAGDWGPLVLPPGAYFMMGDNRPGSVDSRHFGFVERHRLLARVRAIYFSFGAGPEGHLGGGQRVRWRRIGWLGGR